MLLSDNVYGDSNFRIARIKQAYLKQEENLNALKLSFQFGQSGMTMIMGLMTAVLNFVIKTMLKLYFRLFQVLK